MAGRPKGSLNKATGFIKDVAQRYGAECVGILYSIAHNGKRRDADRIAAAELVLAYGYGKPTQRSEFSGPDGGPVPVTVEGADEALERLIKEIKGE